MFHVVLSGVLDSLRLTALEDPQELFYKGQIPYKGHNRGLLGIGPDILDFCVFYVA
jgi:hypothetical protein